MCWRFYTISPLDSGHVEKHTVWSLRPEESLRGSGAFTMTKRFISREMQTHTCLTHYYTVSILFSFYYFEFYFTSIFYFHFNCY